MTEQENIHIKEGEAHRPRGGALRRFAHTTSVSFEYLSVLLVDAIGERLSTMQKEIDLFLGGTLFLVGIFNFSSSKYCDGNTADYLSCTRPTTYYYYSWFAITLIVIGVLLMLVWFVQNRRAK